MTSMERALCVRAYEEGFKEGADPSSGKRRTKMDPTRHEHWKAGFKAGREISRDKAIWYAHHLEMEERRAAAKRKAKPEKLETMLPKVIHPKAKCHPPCPFHAPSEHPMKGWTINVRETALVERLCPTHGVGHPDPDSLKHLDPTGEKELGVHGCCGCCQPTGAP